MKEGSKKVKENNIEEKIPTFKWSQQMRQSQKRKKITKKSDGKKRYKKPLKITKKTAKQI